jgi:hypothetical protein
MPKMLTSLESAPFLYYAIAFAALLGFGVLALFSREGLARRWSSEWLFLMLAGCTVLVWRWPAMLWPYPFNNDEGAFAACALKATQDLAPWRGFDSGSSGPLNSDILALPALFGGEITFFSTRVISLCLLIAAIYVFYFIAKWTQEESISRLAIVPPVTLLSLTRERDFLQYSSEQLPIFLTTIALGGAVFLATRAQTKASRLACCAVSGLVLGSVGFAKLQALPIAFTVLAFLAGAILLPRRASRAAIWAELVTVIVTLCLVPGLIVLSLWRTGVWRYAIDSYLGSAATYVAGGGRVGMGFLFGTVPSYAVFAACSFLVLAGALIALRGRWSVSARFVKVLACAFAFLFVSFVVIYLPGRAFPHYLLFSVLPLSYCVVCVVSLVVKAHFGKGREVLISGVIVAWFVLPALSIALTLHPNLYLRYFLSEAPLAPDRPVYAIAHYAPPGSRVAIWGRMPQFHVFTQTIMATRDYQTGGQIIPGPSRAYARELYLSALRAAPPPVFVDAVAPGSFAYQDRATQGYQTFPELAVFINENYLLKQDVEGIRIFVAKDGKGAPEGVR